MIGLLLWSSAFSFGRRIRDANLLPYLPDCKLLFFENFSDPNVFSRWVSTEDGRYKSDWKTEALWQVQGRKGERGIISKAKDASAAIGHRFRHPIQFSKQTFIVQFEVRAQFHFGCASVFLRLYSDPSFDPLEQSNDSIPFIEFGPEHCLTFNQSRFLLFTRADGVSVPHTVKRSHFIPVDEIVHLYTLIIRPNGTFETLIDNRRIMDGTLADDFSPPLFEGPMIDDPSDEKPADWIDDVLIPNPNEVKPIDWDEDQPERIPEPGRATPPPGWQFDEPLVVPDPNDRRPDDWNVDQMGEWKPRPMPNVKCIRGPGCGPYNPPMIHNRRYRGKWKATLISNPAYKGEWRPRKIPNPNYKGQSSDFEIPPLVGIGFDVWSDQRDIAITNILVGTDEKAIKKWNGEDFGVRQRRQIRIMKIHYDWIRTDLPDDVPESGIIGHIEYYLRSIQRRWSKVRHKTVVIALGACIVLICVPVVLIFCQLCDSDPFSKIKKD
jgi:calnexin